jgi:PAS domain S-box-containing protein
MKNESKAERQLVQELIELRRQVAEMEKIEAERKRAEKEYQTIISTAMDGFWIADIQGNFLDVNDAYCRLIGYSRDELLKMRISDIEAIEKPEETAQRIQKIRETGGDRFETRQRCKDSRIVDIEVSVNYRKETDRMFVFLRNITERKQIEEALRESEKRYKEVVESAAEIIHTTDIQGNFTFANAASLRAAGTSLEKFKQLNYLGIIHPDHRQRLAEIYINQFRERKATIYVEFPILSRSGEVIWLGQNSSLMFEGKKVARDITGRKQMEETLRRSEEEAKRLAQENEVIAEIGRIISSTLSIEEVYERFTEEVLKLIPCDRTAFTIINPEDRTAATVYTSGIEIPSRLPREVFPLAGSATEKAQQAKSGLIIKTDDENEVAAQVPGLLPVFRAGIRSVMMIPLISRDQVIGVLNLQSTKPDAYSERDLRLAEKVGTQITGAIANAQLFAERKRVEVEREKLIRDLQKALSEVKTLKGIFPICASCKKIRDDKGYWNQVEVYIRDHSEAEFSHGICPDCTKKLYGDFLKEVDISRKE